MCSNVLRGESNPKGGEKRTSEVTRRYKCAVDGKSVRVCKKVFLLQPLVLALKLWTML